LAARFNRDGYVLFDNYIYCLAGDGCLMEGISSEAASLAGHLQLHKLIVFYDDNETTIDGKTDLAFSEDVGMRFAAYRWNVLRIDCGDSCDSSVYEKAVLDAKSQTERPTIVIMKTTIGCGAGRGLEGTSKAHGGKFSNLEAIREKWMSPKGLGAGDTVDQKVGGLVQKELDALCETSILPKFHVPRVVLKKFRDAGERGDVMADRWEELLKQYFAAFRESEPELVKDLQGRAEGRYVSDSWDTAVREYLNKERSCLYPNLPTLLNEAQPEKDEEPPTKKAKAETTFKRKAGRVYVSEVLKCFAEHNPALIGGSADVASSCGAHFPAIQGHFLPASYAEKHAGASPAGRYIHFGVREHAALGILNGLASYAYLMPYSSLFTAFYQYGLPAMRMASISKFPCLYIGTHDSIDLGEDGPTHQPVEVLPQLRAMPNMLVIRPANCAEVVGAFQVYAEQYKAPRPINQYVDPKTQRRRPVFIMTSRGELGLPYKRNTSMVGEEGVKLGAYVIHECYDDQNLTYKPLPDIVLIASGQDVCLVMKTKELLLQWSRDFNKKLEESFAGFPAHTMTQKLAPIKVRIVSMPCWELFDEQDQDYQDSVLLSNYSDILRIYVEKASTKNTGHDKYAHFSVLMPSYGLSGPVADVERKLEFTPEFIAAKVWSSWVQRGRNLPRSGDTADLGLDSWVSRLHRRAGSH